jgi:hypothetical protein
MTEQPTPIPLPPKRSLGQLLKISVVLLIFGAVVWFMAVFYQTKSELSRLKGDAAVASDQVSAELIEKVSRLMELPNEKPTIATVEDNKKLASQAFFKKAQNGDKVLMYPKAKKAILYRPSIDKIMEVAYLNVQEQSEKTLN